MVQYHLPNDSIANGTDALIKAIAYTSQEVNILMPMILFMIFAVIFGSGFFSEERKTGKGSFGKWFAISAFITATLSIILFLADGIVNLATVVICVAVSILGTLWLLFSND